MPTAKEFFQELARELVEQGRFHNRELVGALNTIQKIAKKAEKIDPLTAVALKCQVREGEQIILERNRKQHGFPGELGRLLEETGLSNFELPLSTLAESGVSTVEITPEIPSLSLERQEPLPSWLTEYLEENPKECYLTADILRATGRSRSDIRKTKEFLEITRQHGIKVGKGKHAKLPPDVFIELCLALELKKPPEKRKAREQVLPEDVDTQLTPAINEENIPPWLSSFLTKNPEKHLYSATDIYKATGRENKPSQRLLQKLREIIGQDYPGVNFGGKWRLSREIFVKACLRLGQVNPGRSEGAKKRAKSRRKVGEPDGGGKILEGVITPVEENKREAEFNPGPLTLIDDEACVFAAMIREGYISVGSSTKRFSKRFGFSLDSPTFQSIPPRDYAGNNLHEVFKGIGKKLASLPEELLAQNNREVGRLLELFLKIEDEKSRNEALTKLIGNYQKQKEGYHDGPYTLTEEEIASLASFVRFVYIGCRNRQGQLAIIVGECRFQVDEQDIKKINSIQVQAEDGRNLTEKSIETIREKLSGLISNRQTVFAQNRTEVHNLLNLFREIPDKESLRRVFKALLNFYKELGDPSPRRKGSAIPG